MSPKSGAGFGILSHRESGSCRAGCYSLVSNNIKLKIGQQWPLDDSYMCMNFGRLVHYSVYLGEVLACECPVNWLVATMTKIVGI